MSLKLESVSYTYNAGTAYESHAVKNVSFEIKQGEFIGMIGHTGSGKSTLMQQLNGLIQPTSGRVLFNGEDIWAAGYQRKNLRFKVGLVFQYPEHQLFEATVLEDVCFGPKNQKLPKAECVKRAKEALLQVGVGEDLYEKSPFELSGGQKRRVAIAGVIAMNPEILILDEPTAGLDPKGRGEILDLLKDLHDKRGISVVLVSHSMEDVAEYVDRLIVMNAGEKIFDDTPREVFSHYEELEKMGLAAPQVTYLMQELKNRGINVETSVITVDEAKKAILRALGR